MYNRHSCLFHCDCLYNHVLFQNSLIFGKLMWVPHLKHNLISRVCSDLTLWVGLFPNSSQTFESIWMKLTIQTRVPGLSTSAQLYLFIKLKLICVVADLKTNLQTVRNITCGLHLCCVMCVLHVRCMQINFAEQYLVYWSFGVTGMCCHAYL